MSKALSKAIASGLIATIPLSSHALPIDWHGVFGVDTTLVSDYRRVGATNAAPTTDSMEIAAAGGGKSSLSWQSYIFKLAPTVLINDAATFYSELTTGYGYGGFLGDSALTNKGINANQRSGQLYVQNQAAGATLNIKKAYLELYSDTATYMIGRHSFHWGLGALYHAGTDYINGTSAWDRHSYSRDGITMKLKIGNFFVTPYWSKSSNTQYTDATNAKEMGAGLLYDNPERDIAFGMLYGKKSSAVNNPFYVTSINSGGNFIGDSNVTITDLYLKKIFGKFDFTAEVPLLSGDLGNLMNTGSKTTYSAKAILFQSNYRAGETWSFGLDYGEISGQDDSTSKFSALYLAPNFQVANLLFRYNLNAVNDTDLSLYDSSMTNARFFKLRSSYKAEKWSFDTSVIVARALEVAKAGSFYYNHIKDKRSSVAATGNQSDDLGTEIDFNSTYQWNKEISVGTNVGYLFAGDYFGYTNGASLGTKNSLLLQLNTAIKF